MLIRNRLTLTFTLLAAAIQITLSVIILYFNDVFRRDEFYDRLNEKAIIAGRVLLGHHHLNNDFFRNMLRTDLLTIVDEQIMILNAAGRLVFSNRAVADIAPFKAQIPRLANKRFVEFEIKGLETVGIPYRERGQRYYIFTSGYDRLGLTRIGILYEILILANLVGFALIVMAGWYFSGRFLRPISHIVEEVEQITASDLHTRLNEGNQKDEIAQLAITFNQMLTRLEDAFDSQRSFVAHASHELRTPLTNIQGTLETSLRYDADAADYKESMAIAIEELKRVIALTNSLLSLAKVTDASVIFTPIAADECLLAAIGQVQHRYAERTFSLGLDEDDSKEGYAVRGNESLLVTAFSNVLDNACKYSSGHIKIRLSHLKEGIELMVQDKGRGISEQDLQYVLNPLFRGQNTEGVTGHGVGLAVTQRIISLHGGLLKLASQLGQGTTVTITLPEVGR